MTPCYCVGGMDTLTSASRYVTSASRNQLLILNVHQRSDPRSDSTELAEAVPIV